MPKGENTIQYQLDLDGNLAGKAKKTKNVRANDEEVLAHHTEALFDEDEAQNGDKIDPNTGQPYDNSTHTGLEELEIVDTMQRSSEAGDVLAPIKEKRDAAAEWLAHHDISGIDGQANVANGRKDIAA